MFQHIIARDFHLKYLSVRKLEAKFCHNGANITDYSIRLISKENSARDVRALRTSSGMIVREYTLVSAGSVRVVIVRVFPPFVNSKS